MKPTVPVSTDGSAKPLRTDGSGESADTGVQDAGLPEGMHLRADVLAVERVPKSTVPADFPVAIWTDEALALTLKLPYYSIETTTYFSLPETDPDDRLAELLSLHGVSEPAELEDVGMLVEVSDGHCLPFLPDEQSRGDSRGFYGVFVGLTPSIALTVLPFFGLDVAVMTPVFFAIFAICTFFILPLSIYLDGWYLRTASDWQGSPRKLALLSIIPPLYIVVAPYYLFTRENALPLVFESPSYS